MLILEGNLCTSKQSIFLGRWKLNWVKKGSISESWMWHMQNPWEMWDSFWLATAALWQFSTIFGQKLQFSMHPLYIFNFHWYSLMARFITTYESFNAMFWNISKIWACRIKNESHIFWTKIAKNDHSVHIYWLFPIFLIDKHLTLPDENGKSFFNKEAVGSPLKKYAFFVLFNIRCSHLASI